MTQISLNITFISNFYEKKNQQVLRYFNLSLQL